MWTRRKGSEEEEEELEEEEEEEAEIEDEDNYEQDSDEQLTFDVSTKLSRCFDQEGFTVKLVVGASQGASEAENWPQAAQWMECIKLSDHGASLLQHTQNAALAAMDARLALQAAGHDAGNDVGDGAGYASLIEKDGVNETGGPGAESAINETDGGVETEPTIVETDLDVDAALEASERDASLQEQEDLHKAILWSKLSSSMPGFNDDVDGSVKDESSGHHASSAAFGSDWASVITAAGSEQGQGSTTMSNITI